MTKIDKIKHRLSEFFSREGTYSEKMPTAEEVFEETKDIIIKAQNQIDRIRQSAGEKT